MDNGPVEELLSSFASDTFAIQSQPEKDLRASLINFFAVAPNPSQLNHRNGNLDASPVQLANPIPTSRVMPPGAPTSLSFQANELPPHNTPLGSPTEETFFKFSANENNAFSPGNYPATRSSTNHSAQSAPINHSPTPTSDSFGNCLSCLHSIPFHSDNPTFPHAPNCSFDRFNNDRHTHTPAQAQQASQFNTLY